MKEGVVAFVDILGFSNLVKEASRNSDPSDLGRMLRIIENLASINREGEAKKIGEGSYEISSTITSFSDCLVISQHLESSPIVSDRNNNLFMALVGVTEAVSYITGLCLSQGLLVRGGISFGAIKHTKNIIFGAPYIESVETEKNLAVMPRIVVHDNLLKSCEDNIINKLTFTSDIRKDFDGLVFVDWIESYLQTCSRIQAIHNNEYSTTGRTVLENLKPLTKQIELNLNYYQNRSNSQKEFSKWYWMASYVNSWLDGGINEVHRKLKKEMMEKEGITKINL